jgi:hypothetical protein
MRVKVIKKHLGEGEFPTFAIGTNVMFKEECTHFVHWHSCVIDGHETYIPEHYVCNGKLIRKYNPTELVQDVGDTLEVKEIACAWLIATNSEGITGWIPAEAVVTENQHGV